MAKFKDCAAIPRPEELAQYGQLSQHWGSDFTSEKVIFYAKEGVASKESYKPMTLGELLISAATRLPDAPALCVERPLVDFNSLPKINGKTQIPPPLPLNQWTTWSWKDYLADSKKIAKALIAAGTKPHDALAVFGFNSPEWSVCVFGAVFAGATCAGIYPTDTGEQIQYKCDHSNAAVLAVDSQKNFDKAKDEIKNMPYIKAVFSWAELKSHTSLRNKLNQEVKIYSWKDFLESGSKVSDAELQKRIDSQKPSQAAVLVYTSGTTGLPKAVMLSHDAIIFEAVALTRLGILDVGKVKGEHERIVSYLPLSHVAGFMVDIIAPIVIQKDSLGTCSTYFARPYDIKAGSIVERLQGVKPTVFLGVPRIWEKMVEKLKESIQGMTGVKAHLARWAMRQGAEYIEQTNFNHAKPQFNSLPNKSFMYYIADTLVLKKVREKLGLDQAKFCFTGAAPIQLETQKYMAQFGICINEAYGLSEATGCTCWSKTDLHLFGCCGPSFPTLEVKIFKVDHRDINIKTESPPAKDVFKATEEEQGELCFRGRNLMIGYLANPRLGDAHVKEINSKNALVIDKEGFLHTGDKAAISEYGFVKITGRYKEIIVTAGGENVAPIPIEDEIKSKCSLISNVIMIGDKRKFNVALVTLKLEGATGELAGSENLLPNEIAAHNLSCKTIDEAINDSKVVKLVTDAIESTNENGKVVVSNASKIQKFMILPRDFCIVNGDFTPTLKLKRSFVTDRFEEVITPMFTSKETAVKFPMEKLKKFFP